MKKKRTFTILAVIIAVLVLGVGYATISNVTLNLSGTANVKANGFIVEYDTTHTVAVTPTGEDSVSKVDWSDTETPDLKPVSAGAYTDVHNATMTVYLDSKHTEATAIYKVDNNSDSLAATLATSVNGINGTDGTAPVRNFSDYINTPTAVYYTDASCTTPLSGNLAAGASAYLKVTVTLKKAPVTDIVGATFTVTTTATPVEAA